MSWGPSSVVVRSLAAAGLLAAATAAAADILVVRSTGPASKTYPAGRRLPDNALLRLRPSDQVILLDGRGTRVLRGPGDFRARGPAAGRGAAAAPSPERRARIGAVRGPGEAAPRPPSIWHVDVAKSSNVCVADPAKVTLWRATDSDPATLAIAGPSGQVRRLNWKRGSSTLAWPSDLPVADGIEYRLSGAAAATATIRFRNMPAKPAGLEDTAEALVHNRCEAQLDLFIDTLKLPE